MTYKAVLYKLENPVIILAAAEKMGLGEFCCQMRSLANFGMGFGLRVMVRGLRR
jgi:hypothetical protein